MGKTRKTKEAKKAKEDEEVFMCHKLKNNGFQPKHIIGGTPMKAETRSFLTLLRVVPQNCCCCRDLSQFAGLSENPTKRLVEQQAERQKRHARMWCQCEAPQPILAADGRKVFGVDTEICQKCGGVSYFHGSSKLLILDGPPKESK
jgi:hypothetical protein